MLAALSRRSQPWQQGAQAALGARHGCSTRILQQAIAAASTLPLSSSLLPPASHAVQLPCTSATPKAPQHRHDPHTTLSKRRILGGNPDK